MSGTPSQEIKGQRGTTRSVAVRVAYEKESTRRIAKIVHAIEEWDDVQGSSVALRNILEVVAADAEAFKRPSIITTVTLSTFLAALDAFVFENVKGWAASVGFVLASTAIFCHMAIIVLCIASLVKVNRGSLRCVPSKLLSDNPFMPTRDDGRYVARLRDLQQLPMLTRTGHDKQ